MLSIGQLSKQAGVKVPTIRYYEQIGLVAHEVYDFFPQVVKTNSRDMTRAVAYQNLVPVLVKALQEQQEQLDKQQRQIDDIQKRLAKLESGGLSTGGPPTAY